MTHPCDFLAPRACLRAPLPEHEIAADLLSAAADAILAGDLKLARDRLRQADMPALFEFARRLMGPEDAEIHRRRPVPKPTAVVTKAISRMPTSAETRSLYARDGWRCRFCGCRVVSNRARSAMRACVPGAIPWGELESYHGAFFALTASVDHVLPHSAGGGNEPQNLVTACWSCQFGREPTRSKNLASVIRVFVLQSLTAGTVCVASSVTRRLSRRSRLMWVRRRHRSQP